MAQFKLNLEDPVLMFIDKNKSHTTYLGPQNAPDLTSFIQDKIGEGSYVTKVTEIVNLTLQLVEE